MGVFTKKVECLWEKGTNRRALLVDQLDNQFDTPHLYFGATLIMDGYDKFRQIMKETWKFCIFLNAKTVKKLQFHAEQSKNSIKALKLCLQGIILMLGYFGEKGMS